MAKNTAVHPLYGTPFSISSGSGSDDSVFQGFGSTDRERIDAADGVVAKLALTGKLSRAAKQSVREQKAQGLSITFKRGNKIVRQAADGSIEVLGTVDTPRINLPAHVRTLGK